MYRNIRAFKTFYFFHKNYTIVESIHSSTEPLIPRRLRKKFVVKEQLPRKLFLQTRLTLFESLHQDAPFRNAGARVLEEQGDPADKRLPHNNRLIPRMIADRIDFLPNAISHNHHKYPVGNL
ncbi:hypothetical protein CDAR_412121 [Caerostris darwini]|uniref:Uncharacterized protein n=1 Tax=Caerostris darwini TaxID=1538125 RepID=A0AAV4WFM3_9ARAC|nr:hypothetical protein CDAR_412121 [Caerostris darwini]